MKAAGTLLLLFLLCSTVSMAQTTPTPSTPPPAAQTQTDTQQPAHELALEVQEHGAARYLATYLLFAYLLFLSAARFSWINQPNNIYLRAAVERIKTHLEIALLKTPANAQPDLVAKQMAEIHQMLDRVMTDYVPPRRWWQYTPAYTGRQMAAWRQVHTAETMALDYVSEERLRGEAQALLDRLAQIGSSSDHLRKALLDALAKQPPKLGELRELTKEAKDWVYNDQDEGFESLADGQNKAFWLVIATAMILFGISVVFHQAQVLLIAGAAGGLLARLRKHLRSRKRAFDYGVSWTNLFLSPLVGALTGWAGAMLFFVADHWGLVGDKFEIGSLADLTIATVMVSLVFGYSATLFDRFVDKLEGQISGQGAPESP